MGAAWVWAATLSGALAVAGWAAADTIALELNRLEAADPHCRAYLVVENGGGPVERLTLDLVLFDGDGLILRRLAVEAGPLRAEGVAVRAFMIEDAPCAAVARVLLNDVLDCAADACFERIETRSRVDAAFIQ